MDIKQALERIAGHGHLSQPEMSDVMRSIMTGACSDAQIGAFLMGLRMKGETVEEITGAVTVMRELSTKVQSQFIKRTIKKRYVALLDGLVSEEEGTVDLPLRTDWNERPSN